MPPQARELFLEIARCPVMAATLAGQPTACEKVVLCQCPTLDVEDRLRVWERKHHVPEPWVGHLEEARLLFVSANPFTRTSYDASPAPPPQAPKPEFNGTTIDRHPSLGRPFEAPKAEWNDAQLLDRYESLFDVWTEPTGTRLYTDSSRAVSAVSPHWSAARAVASAILLRDVEPGRDYALTEVVRCKSPQELGVDEAATECMPRYLERTLALSPASVLVVFGRRARQALRTLTGYADFGPISPPLTLCGRERRLVFLAHPASRGSKYPKMLDQGQLRQLRATLGELRTGTRYVSEADDIAIVENPTQRDA